MQNGIFRKVTLSVARESVYGQAEGSPVIFPFGQVELAFEEKVGKAENTTMLGSDVEVNDVRNTLKWIEFTLRFKINEDIYPFLLLQKFSINSALVAGETAVWKHTMTYLHNQAPASGQSYTLYWDDPDREDLIARGARWEKLDIVPEKNGNVFAEITGKAQYPTKDAVANAVEGVPLDFVGSNVSYQLGVFGQALASLGLLSASFRHMFGLSDEEDSFSLGSDTLTNLFTLATRFETEFRALMPDNTIKTYFEDGTKLHSKVTMIDTSRYVDGSVASTRPSITITYPAQKMPEDGWKRIGNANEIVKQDVKLLALDDPDVATAPLVIEVVNAVESYPISEAS